MSQNIYTRNWKSGGGGRRRGTTSCHTLQCGAERYAVEFPLKIFSMKADLLLLPLPEQSAARGNLITMRAWQSESVRLLSRLHEEYEWPRDMKDPIRLFRTRNRNQVLRWVIWWDLCPISDWRQWRVRLPGTVHLSKSIIFTSFVPLGARSVHADSVFAARSSLQVGCNVGDFERVCCAAHTGKWVSYCEPRDCCLSF